MLGNVRSVEANHFPLALSFLQGDFSQPLLQLSLQRIAGPLEARSLQAKSARKVRCSVECSALDLLRCSPALLSTGLPSLDALLNGGLAPGCLTELCGPPGSGKSQLCTQLAARAAAVLQWSVLYVDSEARFSPDRFLDFVGGLSPAVEAASSRCFVLNASDELSFRRWTSMAALESLTEHFRPRLLIVDSVAAPLRLETDAAVRSHSLAELAAILKALTERRRLVVLAVNQITGAAGQRRAAGVRAALGNTWSHCVTHRLMLSADGEHRSVTIEKSSSMAARRVAYEVRVGGVFEVEEVVDMRRFEEA